MRLIIIFDWINRYTKQHRLNLLCYKIVYLLHYKMRWIIKARFIVSQTNTAKQCENTYLYHNVSTYNANNSNWLYKNREHRSIHIFIAKSFDSNRWLVDTQLNLVQKLASICQIGNISIDGFTKRGNAIHCQTFQPAWM